MPYTMLNSDLLNCQSKFLKCSNWSNIKFKNLTFKLQLKIEFYKIEKHYFSPLNTHLITRQENAKPNPQHELLENE